MAIVSCPECSGNVSSSANACPHCGFPVAKAGELGNRIDLPTKDVQTVEQTSKKIKIQEILSVMFFFIGLIVFAVGYDTKDNSYLTQASIVGIVVILLSSFWMIIVRFLKWWHHA